MKMMRRLLAAALLLAVCLCAFPALTLTASAAGTENIYYITPKLSDGATLAGDTSDLYVKGILYKNGYLTYTETRTLTFTVNFASGWSYCSQYSSVFAGDTASLVTTTGKSSVTFRYTATAGKSIPFSSLKNICINTTADTLPKLYLTVRGSFERVNKDAWTDCEIRLELGTKQYASGNYIGSGQVKGRGNHSWQKDQKPYSINLNEKTSLLDIPANQKYAIITTIVDESLVRNLIMYQAAQDLRGIDYVVKAEPVEVYLNGEFNGMYTLTERVRLSETKVDLPEATPENIQGAYLVEKTVTGKMGDSDVYFKVPYLTHNDSAEIVTFKDPQTPNKEMQSYVQDIFTNLHDAVMSDSQTAYKKYVDTSSWVDFIIMQEVSKNIDGDLKTSSFFVLDPGSQVVRFTSPWDFDLAFGQSSDDNNNPSKGVTGCPKANTANGFMVVCPSCPWFESLYKKDAFRQTLMERYTEYRYTLIENMYNLIDTNAAYMLHSVQTNVKYVRPDVVSDGVDYLKKWFKNRLAWLDEQWLLDDTASYDIRVTVSGKGSVKPASGQNTVGNGGTGTYTIVPENGYTVSRVTFAGRDVTKDVVLGTYTTPFVTADSDLVVNFSSGAPVSGDEHTIFLDETSVGGTVTASADTAAAGTVIEVMATPADGYSFCYLMVAGNVIAGNTFVMPDEDVTVMAVFAETGKAAENKAVLEKIVDITDSATVKATANQSCKPLKETYTTLTEQAKMLLEDDEAMPEQINTTALELIRLFGILNRDGITEKEVAVYREVAHLLKVDAPTKATPAETWDALTDACCPLTTVSLLRSVCDTYAEAKEDDYTSDSFKPFAEKLAAGQKLLQDTRASQSSLDQATAELSYTGRHLAKRKEGDKSDKDKKSEQNRLAVGIIAGVLAAGAVGTAIAVFLSVRKRRKAKKPPM